MCKKRGIPQSAAAVSKETFSRCLRSLTSVTVLPCPSLSPLFVAVNMVPGVSQTSDRCVRFGRYAWKQSAQHATTRRAPAEEVPFPRQYYTGLSWNSNSLQILDVPPRNHRSFAFSKGPKFCQAKVQKTWAEDLEDGPFLQRSNEKRAPGCLRVYRLGDYTMIILPNHVGIVINHYKDP